MSTAITDVSPGRTVSKGAASQCAAFLLETKGATALLPGFGCMHLRASGEIAPLRLKQVPQELIVNLVMVLHLRRFDERAQQAGAAIR